MFGGTQSNDEKQVQFKLCTNHALQLPGDGSLQSVWRQVWQASWWMGSYGAPTPKRHIAFSNAGTVRVLDLGKIARELQKQLASHNHKSSKTYINSKGKKAFVGTRHLKSTQTLYFDRFVELLEF